MISGLKTSHRRSLRLIVETPLWVRAILIFLMACVLFFLLRGFRLFNDPTATVLLDQHGALLGARIADDQQWRFPYNADVPDKFSQAIIHYEDRWFRFHPGFNPVALLRALKQNTTAGRIVSGGSTITMQTVRLAGKNPKRTLAIKLREILLAWLLELTHSKREILAMYASHAPFGGNVVGLDAAAWRWFGTSAENLSWAEAATLAVLPNSPGLIYPGRNQGELLAKRDKLLNRLFHAGVIDATVCALAKSEKLPGKPWPLPQRAPHLLAQAVKEGYKGQRITSTVDRPLQEQVSRILLQHSSYWYANDIRNAAALIVDVRTGEVRAYVGNLPRSQDMEKGNDVDIIRSPRSTGSILKPLLYAAMLSEGLLLPNTLVPDVPTQIGGFIPENYNLTYDGAVPAGEALARSLNIPAVKMLQTYTYEAFYNLLRRAGMTTLTKPAGHYGLSIILGGAEATLWDLAGIYASMARQVTENGAALQGFSLPVYIQGRMASELPAKTTSPFDPGSVWLTFEAMVEVARPGDESLWRQFSSSGRIAWKTGTSFGNRDAWSIGITPGYVVAVWVGNASGEGRPGLTGINIAAPVLFDIFHLLPPSPWFAPPDRWLTEVPVCRYSGYRSSPICEFTDTIRIPKAGMKTPSCPFHQLIHLDRTGQWQVTSECESPENMKHIPWFVLPPVQEWYFRNRNPFYKVLPSFMPGCSGSSDRRNMEMIYPKHNSILYIPVDLDGRPGSAVFRAAHRNPEAVIYWNLDDQFLGTTVKIHQMPVAAGPGKHYMTLTDQNGEKQTIGFDIISENRKSGQPPR